MGSAGHQPRFKSLSNKLAPRRVCCTCVSRGFRRDVACIPPALGIPEGVPLVSIPSGPSPCVIEKAPFRCSVDERGDARVKVMHKGEERAVGGEVLCKYLFEHLKDIAEAFAGEPVGRCVLSVPAGFTRDQREALKAAGKQAGMPFSLVLSDPVATAIAYGLDRSDAEMSETSRDPDNAK